jgi:hypothetical protein
MMTMVACPDAPEKSWSMVFRRTQNPCADVTGLFPLAVVDQARDYSTRERANAKVARTQMTECHSLLERATLPRSLRDGQSQQSPDADPTSA